jgi:hypothetical protein
MPFDNNEKVYQHRKPPYDPITHNTIPRHGNEGSDELRREVSHVLGRMTTGGGGEYKEAGK